MTTHEFDHLVERACAKIPGRFRRRMANIAFIVESEPSSEQLRASRVAAGEHAAGTVPRQAAHRAQRVRQLCDAGPDRDFSGPARAPGARSGAPAEIGGRDRVARGGALFRNGRGAGQERRAAPANCETAAAGAELTLRYTFLLSTSFKRNMHNRLNGSACALGRNPEEATG